MPTPFPYQALLTHWGIDQVTHWEPFQANVFHLILADERHFVFKAIGPEQQAIIDRLHFEYDVLHHVETQGMAVAVPLLSTAGTPYHLADGQIYRLSRWLPNRYVEPQTSDERAQLYHNYGRALAHFHQALATYQDERIEQRTWRTNLQKRVFDEAIPVIQAQLDPAKLPDFQALLTPIAPDLRAAYADLHSQLIIWDCHPGNVAVDGVTVSGFVDCDHLALAPKVHDLGDFFVHLVKWDLADATKTAAWLAHLRHLLAGYVAVAPLSEREQHALWAAMVGVPLIFMDFFFQSQRADLANNELTLFTWLVHQRQAIQAALTTE